MKISQLNGCYCSIVLMLGALTGCYSFDKGSVRATAGAPESARVADIHIAYDGDIPHYVVAVEPIRFKDSGPIERERYQGSVKGSDRYNVDLSLQREQSTQYNQLSPRARQISAQLTSALAQVENFKVMNMEAISSIGSDRYTAHLKGGEVGPFIFRALITEYESEIEIDSKKTNVIVYGKRERNVKGVVALDVQIVDGRDGSLVTAFPVRGTFSSKSKAEGTGAFSIYEQDNFAKSVIDQALRVALNDAASRGFEIIKSKVRS